MKYTKIIGVLLVAGLAVSACSTLPAPEISPALPRAPISSLADLPASAQVAPLGACANETVLGAVFVGSDGVTYHLVTIPGTLRYILVDTREGDTTPVWFLVSDNQGRLSVTRVARFNELADMRPCEFLLGAPKPAGVPA